MIKKTELVVMPTQHNNAIISKVEEVCKMYGAEFTHNIHEYYLISELPENIQQEIFERKRDTNVFFDWWKWTIEAWKERLALMGFDDATIRFSGFWSQGDGASFTAYCDTQKILDSMLMCDGNILDKYGVGWKQWRLWFELAENGIFKFDIARIGHNYVHENSVQGVIHDDFGGLNDRMWYPRNPEKPYEFTCKFEQKANLDYLGEMFDCYVKEISKKIYSDLEEEYEYLTSDACIKEYLDNNDYFFDKWGNDVEI